MLAVGSARAWSQGEAIIPNLAGRWAMQIVTSQIGEVPLLGERIRTTTSLVLFDVSQDGLAVSAVEGTCSTTIDHGTSLVHSEIPRAFIQSLPATSWTAELLPNPLGIDFLRPWVTSVQGARLGDPDNDPLPTESGDPRVFDQDGDGKPGLTVSITIVGIIEGEVYVVQRDRSRLVGVVLSPEAIDGLVEWTSEQSILGASNPFLRSGSAARPDPLADHSYFRARRVADDMTCDELLRLAPELFGS